MIVDGSLYNRSGQPPALPAVAGNGDGNCAARNARTLVGSLAGPEVGNVVERVQCSARYRAAAGKSEVVRTQPRGVIRRHRKHSQIPECSSTIVGNRISGSTSGAIR